MAVERELILCVPGPWTNRADFVRRVVTLPPEGRHMFAGMILADVLAKDYVPCEFTDRDENVQRAFELAGQGKIAGALLESIGEHASVVYLHFPLDLPAERERILKFSAVMRDLGGIAVKVESCGTAHSWDEWFRLLNGTPFNVYSSAVVLVGDKDWYYSCGMHNFGLAECMVPRSLDPGPAADLINRFNFWRILETPVVASGHTFSVEPDSPHFRMNLVADSRHEENHLFFNPHGVWALEAA